MNFFIYILKCSDDSYYTGQTENVENRVLEHNMGKHYGYTSKRLPVKLVYAEAFTSRIEAVEAERKIKKWGKRKKDILVNFGWQGFINKK